MLFFSRYDVFYDFQKTVRKLNERFWKLSIYFAWLVLNYIISTPSHLISFGFILCCARKKIYLGAY